MHKVNSFGATAQGEFTDGDPQLGVPRTRLQAQWMNTVQRELVGIIEQAGAVLNSANDAQLRMSLMLHTQSIAGLRLLPMPPAPVLVYVQGDAGADDGGDGIFRWDSAAIAGDNGESVVQPASLPPLGRWLRINTTVRYRRTAAEISADLDVIRYAYAPEGEDPRRYDIRANGVDDDLVELQALSDFLEGGPTPGVGRKTIYNGGTIRAKPGVISLADTFRLGGNVRMVGEHYEACALSFVGNFSGKVCLELGPDQSGLYGYSGTYTMGTAIEDMTINSASNCEATINSAGVHQGCHVRDLKIKNVNKIAIQIGAAGGSAYFKLSDLFITGGTAMDASAVGIYSAMESVVQIEQVSIEGGGGPNVFQRGLHLRSGSHHILNLHGEDCTTLIYIDPACGRYHQTIEAVSANGSVGTMLHIPAGYAGTVTVIGMSVAAGSIGIKNDNTGEVLVGPRVIPFYSWSGTPTDSTIIHNAASHVRAHKSVAQSIPNNVLTQITFPTVDSDSLVEWSVDTFTANVGGYYRVCATVQLVSAAWAAPPRDFDISIHKNGNATATNSRPSEAAITAARTISVEATVPLGPGDTADIRLLQVSGGAVDTATAPNVVYVTIDRIS